MGSQLHGKRISFVTSKNHATLTESDRIASAALETEGALIVPSVWNDPSINWSSFDAIIIRSPWDYFHHPIAFLDWITTLERLQLNVWNPPKILRWNMNKRYLLDIQKKGITIPKTCLVEDGKNPDILHEAIAEGLEEVVIKPAVSASAWRTWRCNLSSKSADDVRQIQDLASIGPLLIQQYMPEITEEGEWSIIFFDREFSHAVRKYPGRGDFRVQNELGGGCEYLDPPPGLVQQAESVLRVVDGQLLYARVDGVRRKSEFVLMELELLEPSFYLDVAPEAAEHFRRCVVRLFHEQDLQVRKRQSLAGTGFGR